MRIPATPPDNPDVLRHVMSSETSDQAFWRAARQVDAQGRYLHWDEMRRRPAPEGLSSEEWWAAVKLARNLGRQVLPLQDITGRPFAYCEPPPLRAILRNLDMNAGGALGTSTTLNAAEGKTHLTSSLAEEPFASSLIEGAATTRHIARQMIFERRPPRTLDERMVYNNFQAMEFVKARRGDPLSIDMLLELHRIVTVDTLEQPSDVGRFRTNDEVRVVDEATNDVLHQPPAWADLPQRLDRLVAFANAPSSEDEWLHPLLKAFVLHFMIAYEHPFVDGNGRLARALFYWQGLRANYWLLEYVSISTIIAKSAVRYGRSYLFVETDGSDLTYFLFDQARILIAAISSLHQYVERRKTEIGALEVRLSELGRPGGLNHRQIALLNGLLRNADLVATIEGHRGRHGVSYLTARADLERLADAGLVTKGRRGQQSTYSAPPDLAERLRL